MGLELLRGAIIVLALTYTAAVGYLKLREPALVYAGAGRTFRMVPEPRVAIPWDTLSVPAADSVQVLLLESRIDTASSRPWALYLHGNFGLLGGRGNVARYQLLRDAGFNVLAVEYRGFGLSAPAGKPSESGLYADATAGWLHLTQTLGVPAERLMIYGQSLGGGPAVYLASERPAGVLVTEGTSTSLPDVGAERYPWIPVRLIMSNRFPNLARARKLSLPWVIFHARSDATVPFSHGEALAAAAPHARFVALNGDHLGGVVTDRATSFPVLLELAKRLTPPPDLPRP